MPIEYSILNRYAFATTTQAFKLGVDLDRRTVIEVEKHRGDENYQGAMEEIVTAYPMKWKYSAGYLIRSNEIYFILGKDIFCQNELKFYLFSLPSFLPFFLIFAKSKRRSKIVFGFYPREEYDMQGCVIDAMSTLNKDSISREEMFQFYKK
jgi:hypothetical protein